MPMGGMPSLFAAFILCLASAAAGEPQRYVTIGVTLPLSGEFVTGGESALLGLRARAKQINNDGGIAARTGRYMVKLEVRDNQSNTSVVSEDVDIMGRDQAIAAIIGPYSSTELLACRDMAESRKIVLLSTNATLDDVTAGYDWVFRVSFTNRDQGMAMATFLRNNGMRRAAVLFDERNPSSKSLAEAFSREFERLEGEIACRIGFFEGFSDGVDDYRQYLADVEKSKPDTLFLPVYLDEMLCIIRQLDEMKMRPVLAGGVNFDNEKLFRSGASRLAGAYFVSDYGRPDNPDRAETLFREGIADEGKKQADSASMAGYDAMSLIAEAMRTDGTDREEIRRGLLSIADFPLVGGTISITKDGDIQKSVSIMRVDGTPEAGYFPKFANKIDL